MMKALVLEKNATLKYRDVPVPVNLSDDSYLIRVVAAGVCGSDIQRGFENGAYHYPLIMGHEFSGVIEEVIDGGKYKKGQRVVVFPIIWCGECRACQIGAYAQCKDYNYFGSRCDGGFSEYVWVPEPNLIPIPNHVDIIHAAMTEPSAVALHAVRKLTVSGGESAIVYGGGPIGNMGAQWLGINGCEKIVVVEIDESKRSIAAESGFITINPEEHDPVGTLMEITNGEGADYAVEACGLALTYRQAIHSVRPLGKVVLLGYPHGDLTLDTGDISTILRREITIYGTWNSSIVPREKDDWGTVLKHMEKELQIEPLISHTPKLEDGPAIFSRMVNKQGQFNKVIFRI
ncbi:MAG: galactitol-1-phosphate 5-dehydrogenase [Spirochaetota bacterium]|nr:MAG: galactitol-1-phosphate 5-dehydrogenase [Spirochaetota bacterium]